VDIILTIVGLVLVAVVIYSIYRKFQSDSAEFERRFDFSEEGILERSYNKPFDFQGVGAQTTRTVKLEAGDYRVRYLFPDNVLVKVELLGADDGDGEVIVLKSGSGEAAFSIGAAGRYLLDVDPQDEEAEWTLEISRLGLPSGYKPNQL
jgi:hypothetical protein